VRYTATSAALVVREIVSALYDALRTYFLRKSDRIRAGVLIEPSEAAITESVDLDLAQGGLQ